MKIINQQDFAAGLFFVVLGIAGGVLSSKYSLGVAAHMGPGYFPMVLSIGVGILGSIILIKSLLPTASEGKIEKIYFKPFLIVLFAITLFGLLLQPLGLLASTALLVIVSSIASPEKHLKEILIGSIVLAAFVWIVFIKGLGLIIPAWPAFLT